TLRWLSQKQVRLIVTTDHGTIRVKHASKVIGDRNTNTNLRYKQGKNLNFIAKDVFHVKNPHDAMLPKLHVSSSFIFAREDTYFVHPNNYNHFVNYFNESFQQGGMSSAEMTMPFATHTTM